MFTAGQHWLLGSQFGDRRARGPCRPRAARPLPDAPAGEYRATDLRPGGAAGALPAQAPSPLGKLTETLDPLDFLARVLVHVAEPRLHGARYYGHYSCVARGRRARAEREAEAQGQTAGARVAAVQHARASTAERRRLRRQWAQRLEEKGFSLRHRASQVSALAAAKILVEGLKTAGRDLSREKLIRSVEKLDAFATGLAPKVTYGANRRIGALGAYVVTVDLERREFVPVSGWFAAQ